MANRPTLWDSLREQWQLARELRHFRIEYSAARCDGVWQCIEVCPVGCWTQEVDRRVAIFEHGERCIACGACVLQCPRQAIALVTPSQKQLAAGNDHNQLT